MEKKEWQGYALVLKELLGLGYSPAAVSCFKGTYSQGRRLKSTYLQGYFRRGQSKNIISSGA